MSKSCQVKQVNLIGKCQGTEPEPMGEDLERPIWAQYQQEISDNQTCLYMEQATLEGLELSGWGD